MKKTLLNTKRRTIKVETFVGLLFGVLTDVDSRERTWHIALGCIVITIEVALKQESLKSIKL